MQGQIYDPTKPFNDQVWRLIQETHSTEGHIRLYSHGKRFRMRRDETHWSGYDSQDATDGIGTKGYLHWLNDTVEAGAQDAFAMVVDDLIEGGYVPAHLQDHILMQEEHNERLFRIIGRLVDLCKTNSVVITGGETAIINTLKGFEMGITATGYVERGQELYQNALPGDAIIGIESSGIHSNGLSFYREEFFDKRGMNIDSVLPWGPTVGAELTKPTRVYLSALKKLLRHYHEHIHGMVHVTGGGLSKLRELMPNNDVTIEIDTNHKLRPQRIFQYAHELGTPSRDMYRKFNNGVGYVMAVTLSEWPKVVDCLNRYFPTDVIGHVYKGNGKVVINSQYDNSVVEF